MILAPHHLPLAGLMDVLQALIPLIVMVMWAIGQLGGNKPKQKPARPRPAPPANPPAPVAAAGQGAKPPTLEETLRREVEEFMRRAQSREPAPPAKPGNAPQPVPQRRESRPTRPPTPRADQPVRKLVDSPGSLTTARAPEAPRGAPTGAGVSQHVAQHLSGAQTLATHAQHLGAEVAQADERMAAHLQHKFDHQLGTLEKQVATQPQRVVARPPAAQALVSLLTQPGGIRQVIVASEILRRPEERWSRGEAGRA
jgi:hypothetical protein